MEKKERRNDEEQANEQIVVGILWADLTYQRTIELVYVWCDFCVFRLQYEWITCEWCLYSQLSTAVYMIHCVQSAALKYTTNTNNWLCNWVTRATFLHRMCWICTALWLHFNFCFSLFYEQKHSYLNSLVERNAFCCCCWILFDLFCSSIG